MKLILLLLVLVLGFGLYYIFLSKERYVTLHFPFFRINRRRRELPAKTSLKPFILPLKKYPPEKKLPFIKYKNERLVPIGNQGVCGSCWAFAIADTVADRTVIFTEGRLRKRLSVQNILSCIDFPNGCDGGELDTTCLILAEKRIPLVLESKLPYEQLNTNAIETKCIEKMNGIFINKDSVRSIVEYQNEQIYDEEIVAQNVENMKYELMHGGPFFCALTVYSDLYDYTGDSVYSKSDEASFVGGHAIEIVGYCEKGYDPRTGFNHTGYWICRNSWGENWPLSRSVYGEGYFTVKMGVNECGIESRCGVADPDIPNKSTDKDLRKIRFESFKQFIEEEAFF
jgi:hypothetical protein